MSKPFTLKRSIGARGAQKLKEFTFSSGFMVDAGKDVFQFQAYKLGAESTLMRKLDAIPNEFNKRPTGKVFARSAVLVGTQEKPTHLWSHPKFSEQLYCSDPPNPEKGYESPFWDKEKNEPVISWDVMRPGAGTDEDCIGWETILVDPKAEDVHFNCNGFRKVRGGLVEMRVPVYLNPDGTVHRTGVQGRGVLGRWGPNGAVDPVVTCWEIKLGEDGQPMMRDGHYVIACDEKGFPKLKYVGIVRKDTGAFAHPGGMNIMQVNGPDGKPTMVEAPVSMTLASEYLEEACNHADETEVVDEDRRALETKVRDEFMQTIEKSRFVIKRGRNADPRNTDHAWMVVEVSSIHDDDPINGFFHKFELRAGSDAAKVSVVSVTPNTMPEMYASHGDDLSAAYDLQYYRLTGKLPGELPQKDDVFQIGDFQYVLE